MGDNALTALTAHLKECHWKKGDVLINKKPKKTVGVRFDPEVKAAIKKIAQAEGASSSDFVRKIVLERIDRGSDSAAVGDVADLVELIKSLGETVQALAEQVQSSAGQVAELEETVRDLDSKLLGLRQNISTMVTVYLKNIGTKDKADRALEELRERKVLL